MLAHQPALVRQFLLETAVLDRLNGPLCEAVTGIDGGHEMLERLEREACSFGACPRATAGSDITNCSAICSATSCGPLTRRS